MCVDKFFESDRLASIHLLYFEPVFVARHTKKKFGLCAHPSLQNARAFCGVGSKGHGTKGHCPKGHGQRGTAKGAWPKGHQTKGAWPKGHQTKGAWPKGHGQRGMTKGA